MDGTSDKFFSRTGLPIDEYSAIGWCHESNLLAQCLEGNAFTSKHSTRRELAFEFKILSAQAPGFDRIFQNNKSAIKRQRFFKKVVCAEFGGFYGRLNGAVPRNNDDFGSL